MKPLNSTLKITISLIALTAIAAPAFASDFAALDSNADGQVKFDEYKAVAITEGKTVTLAAQEFTRMSQGDAVLTEDEFFLAEALAGQPYALTSTDLSEPTLSTPMAYEPVENVTTAQTFESYPEGLEAIEPPIDGESTTSETFEATPEPALGLGLGLGLEPAPIPMEKMIETPLEIAPVDADDVEITEESVEGDVLDITPLDVTPVEEGQIDLPETVIETPIDPKMETLEEKVEEMDVPEGDIN